MKPKMKIHVQKREGLCSHGSLLGLKKHRVMRKNERKYVELTYKLKVTMSPFLAVMELSVYLSYMMIQIRIASEVDENNKHTAPWESLTLTVISTALTAQAAESTVAITKKRIFYRKIFCKPKKNVS